MARKNPKRVRAAKRAYKKSGLYKFNLRRKKHKGTKKYGKRRRKHAGAKKHHTRRKRHVGSKKYAGRRKRRHGKRRAKRAKKRARGLRHYNRRRQYKRLSKAEAQAARIQRKLMRSKHVVVVPKSQLTSGQSSYLSKLRKRFEGQKAAQHMPWAD